MKNYIFTILFSFGLAAGFLFVPAITFALETSSFVEELDHTAREEAEGRAVFEKMQSKEIKCEVLNDDDFQALGEYFMGQMTGAAHSAMNNMITAMHGEEGEHQMHIVMGKRLSGCGANAPFDSKFSGFMGFMPMMNMMGFGAQNGELPESFAGKSLFSGSNYKNNNFMPMMYGFGNNMMGWGGVGLTFGIIGLILMLLWWLFVIAAIVFLVKWIAKQFKNGDSTQKSVLDILKERYARGEIDKQEFEEKKKDLS